MRLGLQVGNGQLLGPSLLGEIRDRGFHLVRIQAFLNDPPRFTLTPPDLTTALVQEVLDAGLQPYTMIRRAHQIEDIPEGTDVEFGNEPDLEGRFGWPSRRGFLEELHRTIAIWQGRWNLWTPAISNLNKRGFEFLEAMDWANIPKEVGASVHRYPDPSGPFHGHVKPTFGKRWTRDDEIRELKRIVGERPLALSELGYNNVDFTEAEAAQHMAFERDFFAGHGFAIAIAYQVIDGPNHTHEERYGFRRFEDGNALGSWKPVTESWTGVPL